MDGFVSLTATRIQNAAGALLAAGTLEILPTDGNNLPIVCVAGGVGGPITTVAAPLTIALGILQPGALIADTTRTLPANISYRLTVKDPQGRTISVLKGVQTLAGAALNLDIYQPLVPAQAVMIAGPAGPSGTNGIASLTSLAKLRAGRLVGVNLFDKNAVSSSPGYISASDGSFVAGGNYLSTDYIPANSGGVMTTSAAIVSGGGGYAFYDQNQGFVSGSGSGVAAGGQITVPTNAAFLRFTFLTNADAATAMVVNGSTLPATYQSFNVYPANVADARFATPSQITSLAASSRAATSAQIFGGSAVVNLFDYSQQVAGVVRADGSLDMGYGSAYTTTGFINVAGLASVTSNTTVLGGASATNFYSITGTILSSTYAGFAAGTPITVPAGAVSMRCVFNISLAQIAAAKVIITSGPTPAYYVPYSTAGLAAPWTGKRALYLGDSITAGQTWQPTAATLLSMAYTGAIYPAGTLRGAYSSGTTYSAGDLVYAGGVYYASIADGNVGRDPAATTGFWRDAALTTEVMGYSGHATNDTYYSFAANAATNPSGPSIVQQLTTALANKDLLVIEMGTNDNGTPLGALGDAPYVPTGYTTPGSNFAGSASFYGSLEYVMRTAMQAVAANFAATGKAVPVVFITPYITDRLTATSSPTIAQVTMAIQQVAAEYGVNVLNQSTSLPINQYTWSYYLQTESAGPYLHVHPNAVGGALMGTNFARFIQRVAPF